MILKSSAGTGGCYSNGLDCRLLMYVDPLALKTRHLFHLLSPKEVKGMAVVQWYFSLIGILQV